MTAEFGHHSNRAYLDQASGNVHLNGANLLDQGETPIAQQVSFTIAKGGSAGITLVTMQVLDGAGNAFAQCFELEWFLSDSADGHTLTATLASGTVGAGANGFDIFAKVSKKAGDSVTDATGTYQLSITDSAKTGFYIAVGCPGTGKLFVSRQLVTGDYD